MQNKSYSAQFLRQRRFLVIAPVLILPFITMLFWAMGGGKGGAKRQAAPLPRGFNLNLPGASLKSDKGIDKMAYYAQAAEDSAKARSKLQSDAYYDKRLMNLAGGDSADEEGASTPRLSGRYSDPNEEKVYRKLRQLNEQLHRSTPPSSPVREDWTRGAEKNKTPLIASSDVDRLEKMMSALKETNQDSSPQMQEMSRFLDKLYAVQHPGLSSDSLLHPNGRTGRPPVTVKPAGVVARMTGVKGDSAALLTRRRFYSPESNETDTAGGPGAFEASLPETQVLVAGATVKLQLSHAIEVQGVEIPRGSFVYGTATLTGERLMVAIRSIRYRDRLFDISLQVYDRDGMPGIYIPGAITRDAMKQSADEAVNSLGLTTLDPSLSAQAATAGLQLAKSIASRKVRLVRVTVKAGYQVLLKNAS